MMLIMGRILLNTTNCKFTVILTNKSSILRSAKPLSRKGHWSLGFDFEGVSHADNILVMVETLKYKKYKI